MGEYQKEIDFDRGYFLRMFDEVQLPDDIPRSSASTMLSILRVIEGYQHMKGEDGVWWASIKTMMANCSLSRTCYCENLRVIKTDLKLLAEHRRGTHDARCGYQIVWGELKKFTPEGRRRQRVVPPELPNRPSLTQRPKYDGRTTKVRPSDYQSTTVDNQSTTVDNQSTTVVLPTEPLLEAQYEPPTDCDGWSVVRVELRQAGTNDRDRIDDLILRVRDELGETPDEFLDRLKHGLRIIKYAPNRGKLDTPSGALYWWLWKRGRWSDNLEMVDPDDVERKRDAKAAADADRAHEQLLERAIGSGRREGLSQAEIVRGLLEEGVPQELVDRSVASGRIAESKFRMENFDDRAVAIVEELKAAIGDRWYMWFDDCTMRWDGKLLEVVFDSEFVSTLVRRRFAAQITGLGRAIVDGFSVRMLVEDSTQRREGAETPREAT